MATKLKSADIVIVGLGWTGGILAKELAETGLSIVVLERGGPRDTNPDFTYPTFTTSCATRSATIDAGRLTRDADFPQHHERDRPADAAARLVPARRRRGRRRRPLERSDVAVAAMGQNR